MSNFLTKLYRIWDPRPKLAAEWLEFAHQYENRLANSHLKPEIVEAILAERNRIHKLFRERLPEYQDRISIVVTNNTAEHCAVLAWNNHIYVLVSGALIGRPYDNPDDTGIKAWEWLAEHEIAHIREGHLPWFFYSRRLFQFTSALVALHILLNMFAFKQLIAAYYWPHIGILVSTWLLQLIIILPREWKADLMATEAIDDPSVLIEAEKSLCRMTSQAKNRRGLLGYINYYLSALFLDPHPPLAARRFLLKRKIKTKLLRQ